MIKRRLLIQITDQADISKMQLDIERQYCRQIYSISREDIESDDETNPYPFQIEEYSDEEEG